MLQWRSLGRAAEACSSSAPISSALRIAQRSFAAALPAYEEPEPRHVICYA